MSIFYITVGQTSTKYRKSSNTFSRLNAHKKLYLKITKKKLEQIEIFIISLKKRVKIV